MVSRVSRKLARKLNEDVRAVIEVIDRFSDKVREAASPLREFARVIASGIAKAFMPTAVRREMHRIRRQRSYARHPAKSRKRINGRMRKLGPGRPKAKGRRRRAA